MKKNFNIEQYSEKIQEKLRKIENVFNEKAINIKLVDIVTGPTETHFIFTKTGPIEISKIKNCYEKIKNELDERYVRIFTTIDEQFKVIVEVRNEEQSIIKYDEIYDQWNEGYINKGFVPFGVMTGDKIIEVNLLENNNWIIKGSEGMGKTNLIRGIIKSLTKTFQKNEINFVLCGDNIKKEYESVICDEYDTKVISTSGIELEEYLIELQMEINKRYDMLNKTGHINIASYNKEYNGKMKYTFLFIEHISNVIVSHASGGQLMKLLTQVSTLGRGVGLSMIVSVDEPGNIDDNDDWKSLEINFYSKISLKGAYCNNGGPNCYDMDKLFSNGDAMIDYHYNDEFIEERIQIPLVKE